jgi:HK97 family phage portal protein
MVDKLLTKEQREKVRENFADLTEGRTDQLFVLEADMRFERTSLSPQDMQLLETRRFQTEDICRFMGVPSVLVNDHSGTTAWGSGIYQIVQGFYKLGMRPLLERFETSIKRHLMPRGDWATIDFKFDFDDLLRPDRETRMDANNKAINSGQLTPDEARNEEGRGPMPGGNAIYLNGTLVPAGMVRGQTQGGGNAPQNLTTE